MAEMMASVLVQEALSRGVSLVLGKRKEKSTSQGHIMERLEMAVNELELAVERSAKLPITDVSLLGRRKIIKSAYVEAMGHLDKHKPQAVSVGQQGVKRPRWMLWAKDAPSAVGLSMDDVRRFEWYADCARKFVRDVESGCSLHHYTFCNPIVRHLLEGKTLEYNLEQGNLLRHFFIWPTYSDERGVEAVLGYCYEDSTMAEKCFTLLLFLRLSESTDIVGVATKGLQLLTSEFKLAAEFAMGELTLLCNLQDIAHSYGPPWVAIQERHIRYTQCFRPDPACCKGSRHRLCANNNVSSELSDIFPEQVIVCGFRCYYVPALEPRSSCISFDVVCRSNKSRGGGKPPLLLTAAFLPHKATETQDSYALETIGGDVKEHRDASIQQVAEALESNAINCFFRQLRLSYFGLFRLILSPRTLLNQPAYQPAEWGTFTVEKANMETAGASKTRRYNTRGSTRRSGRR